MHQNLRGRFMIDGLGNEPRAPLTPSTHYYQRAVCVCVFVCDTCELMIDQVLGSVQLYPLRVGITDTSSHAWFLVWVWEIFILEQQALLPSVSPAPSSDKHLSQPKGLSQSREKHIYMNCPGPFHMRRSGLNPEPQHAKEAL